MCCVFLVISSPLSLTQPVPTSLHWRHNELDGVSDHQPHDCLLTCLFRHRSNKASKLRVTGLCEGTGEFPAQKASSAENVSIWWRHHANSHLPPLLWARSIYSVEESYPVLWNLIQCLPSCNRKSIMKETNFSLRSRNWCDLPLRWASLTAWQFSAHRDPATFQSAVLFFQAWLWPLQRHSLNTLRPRQNGLHFADGTFKRIFLN